MSARILRLLRRRQSQGGFTLILVFGILILITLLVVAFLGHALSQVKSVTGYRAQTDSLLLSDVPVNLVKAQIDDATSQSASIWASQPGAIRTFKNDGSDAATRNNLQALLQLVAHQHRPPRPTSPTTSLPLPIPTTGIRLRSGPTSTRPSRKATGPTPIRSSTLTMIRPIFPASN